MQILKDDETRVFGKESFSDQVELLSSLESSEESRWINRSMSRLLPIDNNPICIGAIMKESTVVDRIGSVPLKVSINSPEWAVLEEMGRTQLAITAPSPYRKGNETYVLADTAVSSVMRNAGYGTSKVLNSLKETKRLNMMAPAIKAIIANEGLRLYKGEDLTPDKSGDNKVYNYISDGKLRYQGSNLYIPFPILDAIDVFRKTLIDGFEGYEYVGGTVSHKFTEFLFKVNDTDALETLKDVFERAGQNIEGFDLYIRVAASNTGLCGTNLYPLLSDGNSAFLIENPIKMEHRGSASVAQFRENCLNILGAFKTAGEKLSSLDEIEIMHAEDCFLNVIEELDLAESTFLEKAEIFSATYPTCSGMDLYFSVAEAIGDYIRDTKPSAFKAVKLLEELFYLVTSRELSKLDCKRKKAEKAEKKEKEATPSIKVKVVEAESVSSISLPEEKSTIILETEKESIAV